MQLRNKHLLAGAVPALAVLLACVLALAAYGQRGGSQGSTDGSASSSGKAQASSGIIEVALNANVAPITVSNFCHLANEGFYDGLTFHRVIEGFMIQGGDPNGDGTGGSGQYIKGEFSANNVKNSLPHTRGTISMARSQAYNSASSQFFIMQKDTDSLNGNYAAFGNVTSGMDVVDAICQNTPVTDGNGTVPKESQPKISKITITD